MADKKVTRHSGYLYSPGTAEGFKRMQRLGVPRPALKIENKLTKRLTAVYKTLLRKMLKDFKTLSQQHAGLTIDGAEEDNLEALLAFFDEKALTANEEIAEAQNRLDANEVAAELSSQWEQASDIQEATIEKLLRPTLRENQHDFNKKFREDTSDRMDAIIRSFSINKRELYQQNMDQLLDLYLKNSIQRIKGEEDYLKKIFLQKVNDYVTGKSDSLKIKEVVAHLAEHSEHMARFFARDQLARLNKATTLANFTNAGVTKVKWITSHDIRVRESHRKLDGKIFNIKELPPEIDDYNCRCGLIPVEYEDD